MQRGAGAAALPEAERPIVARALAKDPDQRFPNCLAFVRALYTARTPAQARSIAARRAGSGERRPKTMADTMEDMLLEQMPAEEGPISAGAELRRQPPSELSRSRCRSWA